MVEVDNKTKIDEALSQEEAYLSYGTLNDSDVVYLAEALKKNTTLTSLYVGNNAFEGEGATALAQALAENKSLKKLELACNKLREAGHRALGEALKVNNTLEILNIDCVVTLPDDVAPIDFNNTLVHVFAGLQVNTSVKTLICTSDYLTDNQVPAILSLLRDNKTLESFKVYYNFFSEEKIQELKTAAQANPNLTEFVPEIKYD